MTPRIRFRLLAGAAVALLAACASSSTTASPSTSGSPSAAPMTASASSTTTTVSAASPSGAPTSPGAPGPVATSSGSATSAGATSPPPTHAAPSVGLAGTWSGRYSGSYSGTLVLTLTQTGLRLGGSIKLSAPAATLDIVGQLKAGMIEFGTVGSMSINYEGTLSGGTISGMYRASGSATGRWSATRSS